ncbi:MAG: HAD family phosphatase [Chloroflexota bacterium]|nr:HAD family phosphatase [Chloroflexota bacterium]
MPSDRTLTGAGRVAVLFDLDGVIVDSRACHLRAWQQLARAYEIAVPAGYFRETFGLRNDTILGRLLPGAAPEVRDRLASEKEAAFRRLARGRLVPLPGVADLLDFLAAAGIARAIVTSTPGENLRMVLETLRLEGRFQALVSAEDVRRGKPDPEGFLTAAAGLGMPPSDCVVVEDAPAGIQAAVAGGMRAIGVTTTHPAAALRDAGLVVDSLASAAVRSFIVRPSAVRSGPDGDA